jgi:hypothetical protein
VTRGEDSFGQALLATTEGTHVTTTEDREIADVGTERMKRVMPDDAGGLYDPSVVLG